jgi:hypothetical protein
MGRGTDDRSGADRGVGRSPHGMADQVGGEIDMKTDDVTDAAVFSANASRSLRPALLSRLPIMTSASVITILA